MLFHDGKTIQGLGSPSYQEGAGPFAAGLLDLSQQTINWKLHRHNHIHLKANHHRLTHSMKLLGVVSMLVPGVLNLAKTNILAPENASTMQFPVIDEESPLDATIKETLRQLIHLPLLDAVSSKEHLAELESNNPGKLITGPKSRMVVDFRHSYVDRPELSFVYKGEALTKFSSFTQAEIFRNIILHATCGFYSAFYGRGLLNTTSLRQMPDTFYFEPTEIVDRLIVDNAYQG